MTVLQPRREQQNIMDTRWVRIVLWGIIAFFAISVARSAVLVWQLSVQQREVREELYIAEQRISERNRDLALLESSAGVEKALRSAFNIKKPNEHTIVILDPSPVPSPEESGARAWWKQFKQWFTQTP